MPPAPSGLSSSQRESSTLPGARAAGRVAVALECLEDRRDARLAEAMLAIVPHDVVGWRAMATDETSKSSQLAEDARVATTWVLGGLLAVGGLGLVVLLMMPNEHDTQLYRPQRDGQRW